MKGQLLTEYLENISGKAIEKYQDIIKDSIRKKNGVYALYRKNELVYIGLATDLLKRLGHHLKDRLEGEWDSFSVYITKSDKHLRELEALVMRMALPKANRQKGKFMNAVNLLKDFDPAIDSYFKEEKASFFGEKVHQKATRSKRKPFFKTEKSDMIIIPAREDGFNETFLGEKCWYAIRIKENKIDRIKYVAAYRVRPISAITHFAKVKKIEPYKRTGKYKIIFKSKPRKLQKAIKLGNAQAPQSPVYTRRELLRGAKEMADLF